MRNQTNNSKTKRCALGKGSDVKELGAGQGGNRLDVILTNIFKLS